MKNDIRVADSIPDELENEIFDLADEAAELLEEGKIEASLGKIRLAWEKLPESKYNTPVSHMILCELIPLLNAAGKYEDALQEVKEWILDLETCGYRIYHTIPYVLHGETLLFLGQPDLAKQAFYQAIKYGATKRDFSDKPAFYFDIAKKKLTDNEEILRLFRKEILSLSVPLLRTELAELSEELSERIDVLSEQGSDLFDEENFQECIKVWSEALALIPHPRNLYGETFWLETSIGDCYFMLNEFEQSQVHFLNAKGNIETNAYENPFVMLRLGELFFELKEFNDAKEFLLRAYMLEGKEIFETEEEKYFNFLKENVKLD